MGAKRSDNRLSASMNHDSIPYSISKMKHVDNFFFYEIKPDCAKILGMPFFWDLSTHGFFLFEYTVLVLMSLESFFHHKKQLEHDFSRKLG